MQTPSTIEIIPEMRVNGRSHHPRRPIDLPVTPIIIPTVGESFLLTIFGAYITDKERKYPVVRP